MVKEKQVLINVHTPFTLTLDDQTKHQFDKGQHKVPESVAKHWFVQAYSECTDSIMNDADDQQADIESLQTQLADKDKMIAELKAALVEQKKQVDSLQMQLSAVPPSGEVTNNAKESKSANRK